MTFAYTRAFDLVSRLPAVTLVAFKGWNLATGVVLETNMLRLNNVKVTN